jgi:SAM-dependent methyltransferase
MRSVYRILNFPAVYRVAQAALAPGAEGYFQRVLGSLCDLGDGRQWLDVGCGPDARIPAPAGGLVALDLSERYVRALDGVRMRRCVGDAALLPFGSGRFGAVWSIGLLHHLPDSLAAAATAEMARVCAQDGVVRIFDAVLPEPWWARPHAHWVRRADRGRFMRTQAQLAGLLPATAEWRIRRETYTLTGLELLLCTGRPRPDGS